jgi:hypothetical protein
MKSCYSLLVLAALAVPLSSPKVVSAQAVSGSMFQAAAPSSPFYAQVSRPFTSSSSSNAFLFNAQAQTPAHAAAPVEGSSHGPFSGIAAGVKFGLGGVGFDVATPLVPQVLNLRGGASFFSYSPSITADNITINGDIKLQNADVMLDYFPFHGRFRISGGMTVYNYTNLSATLSVPSGNTFTLGNTKYYSDPALPLAGTGVFNFGGKTAGRVTIGTGNMLPKKGHFTFESEVGVQFFSAPTVVYTITGDGCTGYNSVSNTYTGCGPVAASDVTQEEINLQNDLYDLRFFPVASVGLSYKIH